MSGRNRFLPALQRIFQKSLGPSLRHFPCWPHPQAKGPHLALDPGAVTHLRRQKFCDLTVCQFIVSFPLGVWGLWTRVWGAAQEHVCLGGWGGRWEEKSHTEEVHVEVKLGRKAQQAASVGPGADGRRAG